VAEQWYEIAVGRELHQGDILFECPTIVPIFSGPRPADLDAEVRICDLVVITQTCDLVQSKVPSVLFCSLFRIRDAVEQVEALRSWEIRKGLPAGRIPALHLLDEIRLQDAAELDTPFLVVDFSTPVSLPCEYVAQFAETKPRRPRLLPPYREHLSQAFARYYMRVGLPSDIDPARLTNKALELA